ncbi:hypothetical protein [Sphingobacterium sp. WOUb80]|uniref:hypothetical protein n=1 Tax=Sphingobacterium sp. WOUb80 TaxID=3234028 RepID=UPI003CE932FA
MRWIEIENGRDNAKERAKLILAVMDILAIEGHTALSKERVLLIAGVNESELYKFFGEMANLKEYCQRNLLKDIREKKVLSVFSLKSGQQFAFDTVAVYLDGILFELCRNSILRNLILWSLAERGPVLDEIRLYWKILFDDLFAYGSAYFKSPLIDFKMSILQHIGGMLYLFLRDSLAMDIDPESLDNWETMVKVSEQMSMQIKAMFAEDKAFKKRAGF